MPNNEQLGTNNNIMEQPSIQYYTLTLVASILLMELLFSSIFVVQQHSSKNNYYAVATTRTSAPCNNQPSIINNQSIITWYITSQYANIGYRERYCTSMLLYIRTGQPSKKVGYMQQPALS
jgi:hypothetical protein